MEPLCQRRQMACLGTHTEPNAARRCHTDIKVAP